MKAVTSTRTGRGIVRAIVCLVATFVLASHAIAGPVVREAAGINPAAIQGAVDLFRADLGGVNNGNTPGSQPIGRREINWDGGGAAANATTFPIPMTTFGNRGAVFFTPGSGFEISGQPSPEFGDLNGVYPNLFGTFSTPRLFTALNSNETEVRFTVPGDIGVAAAVTGFGAVFTDVDSATSTKMEFYAPDGSLLFERFVQPAAGNEYLSFLGVSFNAGEVVGRVRIISGNAALGPDETGNLDLVVMDDFIYGEPVPTVGLTISPGSGTFFKTGGFDIVLGVQPPGGAGIVSGRVKLNGLDVTQAFVACVQLGRITGGGQTFRCALPRGALSAGDQVLQVELDLSTQARLRNAVRWTIVASTEP